MSSKLTDKLETYRLLIFNSKDPKVAPLLDAVGIDTAYIDEGIKLYNKTIELVGDQKKEYQEQHKAYDQYYIEKDKVEAQYERTLKLVKVVARNDEDLQKRIKLTKSTSEAIEAWIEGTLDFYRLLLNEPDFLKKIERFKVTSQRLEDEKAAVENLRNLRNTAIAEKGQAQEATRKRNAKLDELKDYCKELKGLAELALEGQPQLLEKLGIIVRSK